MINPKTLRERLVATMRDIPAFAALLGDPVNLIEYKDEYPSDLQAFIVNGLKAGQAALVWNGTGPAPRGRSELWTNNFRLIIRHNVDALDWFEALVNGIPANGDGLDFLRTESIHEFCHPLGGLTATRQAIYNENQTSIDFIEVAITLVEKG